MTILTILILMILDDRLTNVMANSNKISPVVLEELASAPHTEILVSLKSDTSAVLDKLASTEFATRGERATAVSNALKEHAEREQKPLLDHLKTRGLEVQSMWINNQIFVKGAKKEDVEWLAARDEVKEVKENGRIVLDDPIVPDPQ